MHRFAIGMPQITYGLLCTGYLTGGIFAVLKIADITIHIVIRASHFARSVDVEQGEVEKHRRIGFPDQLALSWRETVEGELVPDEDLGHVERRKARGRS
ncbi:hypothetical protein D3C71_756430 [compost metagenome]